MKREAKPKPAKADLICVTLGECEELHNILQALPKLPAKTMYHLMRVADKLRIEATRYKVMRLDIYKEMGTMKVVDRSPTYSVPDDKLEELDARVKELMAVPAEIGLRKLTGADLTCDGKDRELEPAIMLRITSLFDLEAEEPSALPPGKPQLVPVSIGPA